MYKKRPALTLFLVFMIGLIGLLPRYRVESKNKSVGLCLEMSVIRETSAATKHLLSTTLNELKNTGLRYVILPEETLGDLILQGSAQILNGKKILSSPYSLQRIQQALSLRYKLDLPITQGSINLDNHDLEFKSLKNLALGVSEKDALLIKENGLMGIARHSNFYGSCPLSIKETLNRSKQLGIDYYLPENDQLLGFKNNLDSLVESLKELDMFYVSAEFAKMQGDAAVGSKMPERTIRLHSAQIPELEKIDVHSIVERYVRAYKERNIRLLLLRPYTNSSNHPLSNLTTLISDIKNKIERTGGIVGDARPFDQVPHTNYGLLTIFILLFIDFLWPIKKSKFAVLQAAILVFISLQPLYGGTLLALITPFYGYWFIHTHSSKNIFWKYGIWSLISITMGVGIANIGSSLNSMLHFTSFPGVKIVQILPLLGIGMSVLHEKFSLKKVWETPVQWKSVILSCLGIGILGFMLMRSGNDNPATVSSLELKLRSILDHLFYVRPRTKEFLIGHPALWIGLSFMPLNDSIKNHFDPIKSYLSVGGIILGTIGQVSIINTFCHFHTPLSVTFIRVFVGLITGAFIGQSGVMFLKYLFKRYA